ncbi:MoaD/ThiS family protein [Maribacter dokdonensis]|uniref:MoaD/ThiS family protein n=1 Tax=Maribacter dokdonensis TaxID=320912 RepID=UPI001C07F8DF|nr:MoaD/ThiS family protein [Maribacter dokdonensis]MBU2902977.1 MoaD/ThiS family protein [Maribacter dokdonensis]
MEAKTIALKFPKQLGVYVNGINEFELKGSTLNDLFYEIDEIYGDFAIRILNNEGELKPFLKVFINEKNIGKENSKKLDVNNGDKITILLARAGG